MTTGNFENVIHPLDIKRSTDQPQKAKGAVDWLAQNVANPAINAGIVEPYNASANIVKAVSADAINLPKLELLSVPEAELMSGQWMAQNISSGLAMAIPYSIAGGLTGSGMRTLGARLELSGALASIAKSHQVASVLSAAALDGFRDLRPGETNMGNALGGGAGFAIFESGNSLARTLPLAGRIATRAITGVAGASTHQTVSSLVARGELPTADALTHAAVGGAFTNLALPVAQRGVSMAAYKVNMISGRGVLAEVYLQANHKNATGLSPTLTSLVSNNWLRVQDGRTENAYLPLRAKVLLEGGQDGASKLGHELGHHKERNMQARSMEEARLHLEAGERDKAWQSFKSGRLASEAEATLAEQKIEFELGNRKVVDSKEVLEAALPQTKLADGRTYEQIWKADFDTFAESSGKSLPAKEFAQSSGRRSMDVEQAKQQINRWNSLSRSDKLEMLDKLSNAPIWLESGIWTKAVRDSDQQVRFKAVENLSGLNPGRRLNAWKELIRHDDYSVRQLAYTKVGDLPSTERFGAVKFALLNSANTLAKPKHDVRGRQEEYVPTPPDWAGKETRELLRDNDAAALLVKSIETVPGASKRLELWNTAHAVKQTESAAARNVTAAGDLNAQVAWRAAWGKAKTSTSESHYGSTKDAVVSQIPNLSKSDRMTAMEVVMEDPRTVGGQAMAAAIKSLDPEHRISTWNRLYQMAESSKRIAEEEGLGNHRDYMWRTGNGIREYMAERRRAQMPASLARAIESLPESEQPQAWFKVATLDKTKYAEDLRQTIGSLPEGERLRALKHAIEEFPGEAAADSWRNYQVHWQMASIPTRQYPELARYLLDLPEGKLRETMLNEFSVWTHRDQPVEGKAAHMTEMLNVAAVHGKPADFEAIRKWLFSMPEPESMDWPPPRPVQEIVAAQMDATSLGRILVTPEYWPHADKLAREHPEVLREIAKQLKPDVDSDTPYNIEAQHLGKTLERFYRTGSLTEAIKEVANPPTSTAEPWASYEPATKLVYELGKTVSSADRKKAIDTIREGLMEEKSHAPGGEGRNAEESMLSSRLALFAASHLGKLEPEYFNENFVKPVQEALSNPASDYSWRLNTARGLAAMQRNGALEGTELTMPNLRMPEVGKLTDFEKAKLRSEVEEALLMKPADLYKLMGDGALGKLFPTIFGDHTDGGIVGRPQHGGHEYALHAHTLLVVKRVTEHPEFQSLSSKDQVNLLWAALLHDVGKRPSKSDPDHEWASANLGWGVLKTLGYPVNRIQRISSLVSRHREMSFDPSAKTTTRFSADDSYLNDLSTYYRHPSATTQLQIFNESDIKSIDTGSTLWTPDVSSELRSISRMTKQRGRDLNNHLVPLLTSEVRPGFRVIPMTQPYAVLGHVSSNLESSFLKQLSVIESPEYSISASLLTPTHKKLYYDGQPLIALVSGPFEQISQAYRGNLGTGTSIDWNGHVKLVSEWSQADNHTANKWLPELEGLARKAGVRRGEGQFGALETLRKRLSQYDSFDELVASEGKDSPHVKAQQAIHKALTTEENGEPLKNHNEVKLNNPVVVGLGVIRNGRPVILGSTPDNQLAAQLLTNGEPPKWLSGHNNPGKGAIVIGDGILKSLEERRLPIVILDP